MLKRLREYNITLRREKCHFGQPEVLWFGNVYSCQGMSPDPAKVQIIKDWPAPGSKSEIKSFLQTVQFCAVFMRPGGGRTYADVTSPLRKLTAKQARFKWDKQCQDSFVELKTLLCSDMVMANYEVKRDTRLYVDHGPEGLGATVAQKYDLPDQSQSVWRPVHHGSRSLKESELNYGKPEGESLAILSGILSNKMYLYGTHFEVITDHAPLVSMYNSPSKPLPVRIAKHKSKLQAFSFVVNYEPGSRNPADYASRHPPPDKQYSKLEKDELGVEELEEDMEIMVNRIVNESIPDAVTLPVVKHYTKSDKQLSQLVKDVQSGRLRQELKDTKYGKVFPELTYTQGVLLRQERLVIPQELRADVVALAHEGHPGIVPMLRQLRQDVWWPGMTEMVKEYVATCSVGCAAANFRNASPPMMIRDTPEKPWEHLACDYKGPIGGKYYFHVTIDTYTRWPEVDMTTSTSMEKLYPALDKMFGRMGYPESITHDNGPPYDSKAWRGYAKECGFKSMPTSPEHPEGNGLAERFMGVLVKITHAAIAEKLDPRVEVQKRLLNYRNTPHPSTNKTPSELMMGRKLKTKIPSIIKVPMGKEHQEAKEQDRKTREERKVYRDKKKRAKDVVIKPGNKVLIAQKKTTIKPPYNPDPMTVVEVKGPRITAIRGDKIRVRNKAKFKLIQERPDHLKPLSLRGRSVPICQARQDSDSEDDWLDISRMPGDNNHARLVQHAQAEDVEGQGGADVVEEVGEEVARQDDVEGQGGEEEHEDEVDGEQATPPRARKAPERFQAGEVSARLSPQQRKRRQSQAKKTGKNRLEDGTILCLGGTKRFKPPPGMK